MSDHRFKTPEEQVLWFLSKAGKPGWKWMSLRPRSPLKEGPHNVKKTEKDSYFCKSVNCDSNMPWSLKRSPENTGLFEMIVRVLTACHTQYT